MSNMVICQMGAAFQVDSDPGGQHYSIENVHKSNRYQARVGVCQWGVGCAMRTICHADVVPFWCARRTLRQRKFP